MTEKRFTLSEVSGLTSYKECLEIQTPIIDNGKTLTYGELISKLNKLHEDKEIYKMLWEQMAYYFEEGKTLHDLDHTDFHSLQRLAKGFVD